MLPLFERSICSVHMPGFRGPIATLVDLAYSPNVTSAVIPHRSQVRLSPSRTSTGYRTSPCRSVKVKSMEVTRPASFSSGSASKTTVAGVPSWMLLTSISVKSVVFTIQLGKIRHGDNRDSRRDGFTDLQVQLGDRAGEWRPNLRRRQRGSCTDGLGR